MLFRRREVNEVLAFPVRWHTPRDLLLGFRNGAADDLADFIQVLPDVFILFFNVLIYCFDLAALMTLSITAESPTAFQAFPHILIPPH